MTATKRFSRAWVINQLKLNSVALISLMTALSGLGYNSWRDHQNEINDNMRNAAFEVLRDLGELQAVVNFAHYADDSWRGHPIDGWKNVVMVRDLSRLLDANSAKAGERLYSQWQQDWESLGTDENSEARISAQIKTARQTVLQTIDSLE